MSKRWVVRDKIADVWYDLDEIEVVEVDQDAWDEGTNDRLKSSSGRKLTLRELIDNLEYRN